LRFAAYFKRSKGVQNRFIVIGNGSEQRIRAAMGRAFPDLVDEEVVIISSGADSSKTKESDASVATYWKTAYGLLQFSHTKRKFYLVQDLESLFYSGGSISGLVEATYRFGFYCIANTQVLKEIYERNYSGKAESFTPCVDTDIFFCDNLKGRKTEGPTTVFFYARPWHPRNGFELGAVALRQLKGHLGAKVRIVAAGGHWKPSDFGLQGVVENLGVLDYVETAALYRSCDVGLVLRFTPHPSYIPFELMASGCLVVSNFNSGTAWLLQDRVNCLVAPVASASCLCQVLERAILNEEERNRLTANAAAMIRESYADWEKEMEKIFSFMCDPA
jgi:glycosyltransferase involved in cell wall biosynthesis